MDTRCENIDSFFTIIGKISQKFIVQMKAGCAHCDPCIGNPGCVTFYIRIILHRKIRFYIVIFTVIPRGMYQQYIFGFSIFDRIIYRLFIIGITFSKAHVEYFGSVICCIANSICDVFITLITIRNESNGKYLNIVRYSVDTYIIIAFCTNDSCDMATM
ncbi:hypothetical protein D3C81_951400 [compost metagenome]